MAEVVYYDASFGGMPLLISKIDTEGGRDVVVQSPSRGDKHVLSDRGLRHGASSVDILFVNQPGLDAYTTRYEQFISLAQGSKDAPPDAQIFSHPLVGSYLARIGDLKTSADSSSLQISVSCTIHPEDEPQMTFPVGAGTAPAAGVDAVSTAADNADAELAAVGLSTPVTAACTESVTDWSTTSNLDSQSVFVGIASLTGQISDAIDELDLATDLNKWPAYQALVNLHYQVSRAGEALTATAAQMFQITVAAARPMLAICSDVYGADEAADRADDVTQINRVRTPGLVPAGTVLKMPPRTT